MHTIRYAKRKCCLFDRLHWNQMLSPLFYLILGNSLIYLIYIYCVMIRSLALDTFSLLSWWIIFLKIAKRIEEVANIRSSYVSQFSWNLLVVLVSSFDLILRIPDIARSSLTGKSTKFPQVFRAWLLCLPTLDIYFHYNCFWGIIILCEFSCFCINISYA